MLNKIIGRNISILYRHEMSDIDKELKEFNLNKIQAEFIFFLKLNNGVNQTELNKYFMFNKATVTKIIKILEFNGYVSSCINESDKREKNIYIQEKGIKIIPKLKDILGAWESKIIRNISEGDIDILKTVLSQMVNNINKLEEENR